MKNDDSDILQEGQIRVIKPFGPTVAWVKIPSTLVEKLNNYIDKIVEDKTKSGELNYGNKLVGDVTQEITFGEKIC